MNVHLNLKSVKLLKLKIIQSHHDRTLTILKSILLINFRLCCLIRFILIPQLKLSQTAG